MQTTGKKNVNKLVKYSKIGEFHDHIWNHHEKYIQMIKNIGLPGIDSVNREIAVNISEMSESKQDFVQLKPMSAW